MRRMVFCKRCGNYDATASPVCPKCGAGLLQAGQESVFSDARYYWAAPETETDDRPRVSAVPAGHVRRFVAILIDSILLVCIGTAGASAFVFIGGFYGVSIFLIAMALAIAYEPGFIAASGATPGKSAMGLRVVNEYGEPVSLGQSIARWAIKQVFNALVVPLFVPLFSKRRRALHDMVVSTYVVQL
jgi:uncharacterized RDD family membrane protein YckC